MLRITLTGVLLLLFTMTAEGSTIYKWVDEYGVTQYSETSPSHQKAIEIITKPSYPAAATDDSQATTLQKIDLDKIQRARQEAAEAKEKYDALDRKQKCNLANQYLNQLSRQGRIYRINEKGEKEYMDDNFHDSEIERTKKYVEMNCDS